MPASLPIKKHYPCRLSSAEMRYNQSSLKAVFSYYLIIMRIVFVTLPRFKSLISETLSKNNLHNKSFRTCSVLSFLFSTSLWGTGKNFTWHDHNIKTGWTFTEKHRKITRAQLMLKFRRNSVIIRYTRQNRI